MKVTRTKNKICRALSIVLLSILFINTAGYAYNSPNALNSCGLLYAIYDDKEIKGVNGFLLKKDGKTYFITVLHVSMLFDRIPEIPLTKINIELPEGVFFEKEWGLTTYARGDDISDKKDKETIDILVIDVTTDIKDTTIPKDVFEYSDLVSMDIKDQIDGLPDKNVNLVGYPGLGNGFNKSFTTNLTTMRLPESGFGSLVKLPNGENPSGFFVDLETEHGDCGRPVIVRINDNYKVAGLTKTGINGHSFAIDSTAIIRTINFMEKSE